MGTDKDMDIDLDLDTDTDTDTCKDTNVAVHGGTANRTSLSPPQKKIILDVTGNGSNRKFSDAQE